MRATAGTLYGFDPAVAVASLALATGVAAAPFVAWRVVHDLRYTVQIPGFVAERIVPYENDLDGRVFDRLAAAIPEGDTYFVETTSGPGIDVFEGWARTFLLPRLAVSDPEVADWIVSMGVHPTLLGVRVSSVRIVPTSYGEDAPKTYLAKVVR